MAGLYRHMSIYVDNKRVVKCDGLTYRLMSAAEAVFNDNGYDGETEAPFNCEITATTVEPVGSSGIDLYQLMLRRTKVRISLATHEGKIHEIKEARVTQAETTSSAQNGKLTGSYTFRGGEPKVIG